MDIQVGAVEETGSLCRQQHAVMTWTPARQKMTECSVAKAERRYTSINQGCTTVLLDCWNINDV